MQYHWIWKWFCLLRFLKGTFIKNWNWCIITVALDTVMKESTVYSRSSPHFIIKPMKKYRNICSYFYCMNYVQIFFVGVSVNQTETEMFIYLWNFFTRDSVLNSDSYVFAKFTCKLFMTMYQFYFSFITNYQYN